MKYLKAQSYQLQRLLHKDFTFPRITVHVGSERNGWNEPEDIISVYACLSYGEPKLGLLYQSGHENVDEIRAEVDLWNTDPRKFWIGEIARLYVEANEALEEYVVREKERLKALKKRLKKIQEKN